MNETDHSEPGDTPSGSTGAVLSSRETEQPTKPLASPSTPPSAFSMRAKKSRKPLFIGLVVLGMLLVGVLTYALLGLLMPAKSSDDSTKTESSATVINPDKKAIDEAASIYTTAADTEADTLNTDDSTAATDASDEAGTIGDSIDENTF